MRPVINLRLWHVHSLDLIPYARNAARVVYIECVILLGVRALNFFTVPSLQCTVSAISIIPSVQSAFMLFLNSN